MTNIQLKGGKEIDLLAVNPINNAKWHVEARVSTTMPLRMKASYTKSDRCHKNGLDYFQKEKFEHKAVKEKIRELFGTTKLNKWLVVYTTEMGNDPSWIQTAYNRFGIKVILINDIVEVLKGKIETKGSRDDVLRLLELISKPEKDSKKMQERFMREQLRRRKKHEKELREKQKHEKKS